MQVRGHTEKCDFTRSKDSSAMPPMVCTVDKNSRHSILQASSSSVSAKLVEFS